MSEVTSQARRIFVAGEFLIQINHPEAEAIVKGALIPLWENPATWGFLRENLTEIVNGSRGAASNLEPVDPAIPTARKSFFAALPKASDAKGEDESALAALAGMLDDLNTAPPSEFEVQDNIKLREDTAVHVLRLTVKADDTTLLSFIALNNLILGRISRESESQIRENLHLPVVEMKTNVNHYTSASVCNARFGFNGLAAPIFGDPTQPIVEGGPGSVPIPYTPILDASGKAMLNQIPYQFKLLEPFFKADGSNLEGKDVDVIILDSVPSKQALDKALADYPDHPLLKGLWSGADCALSVYSALSEADKNTKFAASKHPGRDHGIFIAGLIHSIAPKARLHLIEVLNEDGNGTDDAILNAIKLVRAINSVIPTSARVIINCSWHLPTPADIVAYRQELELDPTKTPEDINLKVAMVADTTSLRLFLIDSMLEVLTPSAKETIVIAAAGNEAAQVQTPAKPLAETNTPARFNKVFGVGALNRNPTRYTDYTNEPDSGDTDLSEDPGFAVFGGEVLAFPGTAGNKPRLNTHPHDGILGLCITDFVTKLNESEDPDKWTLTKNDHGWGRWAGTSFAAAVMSGLVALLGSNGWWETDPTHRGYQNVLDKIKSIMPVQPPTTPYKISVDQTKA